jgi:hypothetical protein
MVCACVLTALLTPWVSAQSPLLLPAPPEPLPAEKSLPAEKAPAPAGELTKVGGAWREPIADVAPPADSPPARTAGRFWLNNEVLMWWIQGMMSPELVTTAPAGTPAGLAGVIGQPTTVTLFPTNPVDNNMRFGWRSTLGSWLDDEHRFAAELQFLLLASGGKQFSAASDGTPGSLILVRPVTNGVTNGRTAEPIAVPGQASGAIHISTSTSLIGAGFWFREQFCGCDDPCGTCKLCWGDGCNGNGCSSGVCSGWRCRFDSLFGYRYLRLADHLAIDDTVTAQVALNGLAAGAQMQRSDRFDTHNTFHGIDIGVTGWLERGPWSLGTTAKVAIGALDSSADILGARVIGGVVTPNGLLAQPTNIGHFSRVHATGIPELDLKFGYALRPNLRLYADYSFLYLFGVLRAGNQADINVDPAFLLTTAPTGVAPTRPSVTLQQRDIWVQGISVGLVWSY